MNGKHGPGAQRPSGGFRRRSGSSRQPGRQVPDQTQRDLREPVVWSRQLIKSRTMHRNQLEHASYRTIIKGTNTLIEQLDKQIERVEKELNQLIDDDPHWSNVNDILQSMPGVGPETARTLIVECPDLGDGKAPTLCSLTGLVRAASKMRDRRIGEKPGRDLADVKKNFESVA